MIVMSNVIEDYLNNVANPKSRRRIAINCRTRKELKKLLKYYHKKGYVWSNGYSLRKFGFIIRRIVFNEYQQYTCIFPNHEKKILKMGSCNAAKGSNWDIVFFCDLNI